MFLVHHLPPGPTADRPARSAPVIAAMIALVVLSFGCARTERAADVDGGPLGLSGVELAEPTDRPQFVLTDTTGRPFDFGAETRGELTLMYFGYTSCPDICPVHLAQLAEVLDRPGMPDATVVFVSVDPARDTPEVIADYLARFDDEFIGLTGTDEQLVAAQEASNVVPAQLDDVTEDGYLVGHAGQLLAFSPDDRGYVIYPFGTRQSELYADLPVLAALSAVEESASG